MNVDASDDLVSVLVPRRFYARVIQLLATALSAESNGPAESAPSEPVRRWTAEDIQRLRRALNNDTVTALMDLTCASPGKRVTFQEIYERAGRTYAQARADLAGFTRLIRKSFGRERRWPVTVVQGPDKALTYHADPTIADAWKNTLA